MTPCQWNDNWRTPVEFMDDDARLSEADRIARLEKAGVPRHEVTFSAHVVRQTLDSRKRHERSKVGAMLAGAKMGRSHMVAVEDAEAAFELDAEYDAQIKVAASVGGWWQRRRRERRGLS